MNKYLHQHPLIPDISQQNLIAGMIRKQAVFEMYIYCKIIYLYRYGHICSMNGILRIDGICKHVQLLILYLY
jgi:hypothetical protein